MNLKFAGWSPSAVPYRREFLVLRWRLVAAINDAIRLAPATWFFFFISFSLSFFPALSLSLRANPSTSLLRLFLILLTFLPLLSPLESCRKRNERVRTRDLVRLLVGDDACRSAKKSIENWPFCDANRRLCGCCSSILFKYGHFPPTIWLWQTK